MTQHLQDVLNALGAWAIPLAGCVAFTIIRFLLAPYYIWKQEYESRAADKVKSDVELSSVKDQVNFLSGRLDERAAIKSKKEFSDNAKLLIAGHLEAARRLQKKCVDEYTAPFDEVNSWNSDADAYLGTVSAVYQMRFRSEAGITPGQYRGNFMSENHLRAWAFLYCRMYRLDEFLKEEIEPGLDSFLYKQFRG